MAFNTRSADVARFSMVPGTGFPRSIYHAEQTLKTTFDASYLYPIYLDEILPGDTVKLRMTAFCRLAAPIRPFMDNLHLETFFFFVPMRLVWPNSKYFFGETVSGSSTPPAYLIPQLVSPASGFAVGSLADYFGLPTVGQITAGQTITVNSLPFRAYNMIWNEWFRDQNIQATKTVYDTAATDGPDTPLYGADWGALLKRGKRHDYFTTCLPWPQKPIGYDQSQGFGFLGGAPVTGIGAENFNAGSWTGPVYETGSTAAVTYTGAKRFNQAVANDAVYMKLDTDGYPDVRITINNLRNAVMIQNLLEREARGGTRYTEQVRAKFGVTSPDHRLQRPEYLGGGSTPISVNPVVQSSATALTGGLAGLGQLGGFGTGVAQGHGFAQSFTEHGYVIGIVNVRADITYQQGVHKLWRRLTSVDFYQPDLANLGEQAVLREEIYCTGTDAEDTTVFGYQERWSEYRHKPSRITGLFKSTSAANLDEWHLSEQFSSAPTLSDTFISDQSLTPIDRGIVTPSEPQFLFDALFAVDHARVMPTFSIPGLGGRF